MDRTTHLQQRVSRNDRQEPLEALTAGLDDLVREAVREDLAGEGRDVDARRLALEDVPEGLEVRVAPPHDRVSQFEGGDVRLLRGCMGWVGLGETGRGVAGSGSESICGG